MKKRLTLNEASMLKEYYSSCKLFETKVTKYNEILNEGFFDKLGQGFSSMAKTIGRAAIPGYQGYGGTTTRDLEADIPEMKALEQGLKTVAEKEKALKNMKIGNIDALDGALDQYVTSLIDLYSEFKDIANNEEKSNALPGVYPKLQSTFKAARETLRQLQQAVGDASTKVAQALKGSKLASGTITVPAPRTGIPAAADSKRDLGPASRPGQYQRGRFLAGAGTAGGMGLRESKRRK